MSKTIDERVVSLEFDNSQFEQNVQVSLTTLDKLKESLKFGDETKQTFEQIEANSKNVKMGGLSSAIDSIKLKFSSLDIVAATVIGNITNMITNKAVGTLKTAFDSVIGGGIRRAQNLEKAYFTMSNIFQDMGDSVWDAANDQSTKTYKVMEYVKDAVNGTAFSMDEAAVTASQLAASFSEADATGDMMEKSLKLCANMAAITGSSYGDLGNIMSTIAGTGNLMGDHLMQLSTRGLNVAADLAEAWGMTEQEVRDMASEREISYERFMTTLADIPKYANAASAANKTFSGALANTKSALSRIGADVAVPGLESFRKVLLSCKNAIDTIHKVIQPLLEGMAAFIDFLSQKAIKIIDKFSTSLADINNAYQKGEVGVNNLNERGEKLVLIFTGLVNILQTLGIVFGMFIQLITFPIRPFISGISVLNDGFIDMASSLTETTIKFREWVSGLSGSLNTKLDNLAINIKNLIRGFVAWLVEIKHVGANFKSFIDSISNGDSVIQSFSKIFRLSVVDAKTGEKTFTTLGKAVNGFKKGVSALVEPIQSYLKALKEGAKPAEAFSEMISKYKQLFTFKNVLEEIHTVLDGIGSIATVLFDRLKDFFGDKLDSKDQIGDFAEKTGEIATNAKESVSALDSFKKSVEGVARGLQRAVDGNLGLGEVMAVLLGVGLIYGLRKLSKTVLTLEPVSAILKTLNANLGQLGKTIKDFRFVMVTKQITTFALALTALTVAMTQLAQLPADQVWAAGLSIALIAGVIGGLAIVLTKISGGKEGKSISNAASKASPILAIAKLITALAFAVSLLALAIRLFSSQEDTEFQNGLKRLLIVLGALTASIVVMSVLKTRVRLSSKIITSMAASLLVLTVALKLLSTITVSGSLIANVVILIALMTAITLMMRQFAIMSMAGASLSAKNVSGVMVMASAMLVLSLVIKILSTIDFSKELVGKIALFGVIITALMSATIAVAHFGGGNAAKAGAALLALSVSVGLMCLIMKIAGTLTAKEIVMGLFVANSLIPFFGLIIAATYFAGANAAKAGVAIIAFAGAMVLITACIAVISHINLAGVAKGILAIDAVGLMMVALVKSTEKAKITKSTKGVILMFAVVIAVLTASIGVLSMIKTSKVLSSVLALVVVIGAFDTMMIAVNKMQIQEKTLAVLGTMIGCVAAIGIVLFLLGQLKVKNTLAAAAALTATMAATIGVMLLLQNSKWDPVPVLKNMLLLIPIMAAMAAFIFLISNIDVKPAHAAAIAAIGSILIPLSVSLLILSTIGPAAEAALPVIGIIMAVILAIGAAFTALGYVFNGEKGKALSKAMDTGIEIMGKLGKMMGAFVGGIAEGVLDFASRGLAELGANLSLFMENASGFIQGVKSVPEGVGKNAKDLSEAILALSGAKFIDAFSNFMSWLQWPFGDPDVTFANNIGVLADGIASFAEKISGIEKYSDSIYAAKDVASAISDLFEAIPKSGGLISFLEGNTDLNAFVGDDGSVLTAFAEAIKKFSAAFDNVTINTDAIRTASEAAGYVAEFMDKIPKDGGLIQSIAGHKDLGQFSANLVLFGDGITKFSSKVSGIKDAKSVKMAAKACESLASASATISEVTRIDWNKTDVVKAYAPDFGTALNDFSKNTKDVDASKIKTTTSAVGSLVNAIKKATKVSSGDGLANFKNMAKNLGSAVKSAAEKATAKTTKVTQDVKVKGDVDTSSLVKSLNNAIGGLAGKAKGASNAGKTIAKQMKSGFSSVTGWRKEGANAGQGFVNGLADKADAAYRAGLKVGKAGLQGEHDGADNGSPSREGRRQGAFLGEGFRLGLLSMVDRVYSAGKNVGSMGLSAIAGISQTITEVMDDTLTPTITPVIDFSQIQNGVSTIDNMFSRTQAISAGSSFNARISPEESMFNNVVKEIGKLADRFDNAPRNSTVINGLTYDDGSNIANAVKTIVHATKMEGRI